MSLPSVQGEVKWTQVVGGGVQISIFNAGAVHYYNFTSSTTDPGGHQPGEMKAGGLPKPAQCSFADNSGHLWNNTGWTGTTFSGRSGGDGEFAIIGGKPAICQGNTLWAPLI